MDIGEVAMAQGVRVDIDPAGAVGQRAFTNEVRCHLRRYHVQHVEGLDTGFAAAIGQGAHEGGALVRAVHGDQAVGKLRSTAYLSMYFISAGT